MDPDNPSLLTKCCPDFGKHLEISLDVDCHRLLVVVLEPNWSNDAMFKDGNSNSALHGVSWSLQTVFRQRGTPKDVVLRVDVA